MRKVPRLNEPLSQQAAVSFLKLALQWDPHSRLPAAALAQHGFLAVPAPVVATDEMPAAEPSEEAQSGSFHRGRMPHTLRGLAAVTADVAGGSFHFSAAANERRAVAGTCVVTDAAAAADTPRIVDTDSNA
jgi:hypothetical protein